MRKGYRRILFAVQDATEVSPAALRKVAALAQSTGARVELYHALTETVFVPRPRGLLPGPDLDDIFDAVARKAAEKLNRLAHCAALRGVKTSAFVDWDYPAHEAIVRRALVTRSDLVVVEAHRHAKLARPFLQNTDWELIRHCPVPLLLFKGSKHYERPSVLVAVDPFHAADKPAALDRRLLTAGRKMVEALEGTLHAAHAWLPLSALVPSSGSAPIPVWLPAEAESAHANRVRKAFQQLTRRAGITTSNGHLIAGPIQTALQTAVRQSRASIMVMGAISRRGLKRLFIGNTAERMLDRVDCDVLIVKPAGFSSSIRPRITPREPVIGPLAY